MIPLIINTGLTAFREVTGLEVEVLNCPTISVDFILPDDSLTDYSFFNENPYLVFLSKNGVRGFVKWIETTGRAVNFQDIEIWATGEATASIASELLAAEVNTPIIHNAHGLIDCFRTKEQRPVILVSGSRSRPELPEWLHKTGWEFLPVVVYRTQPVENKKLSENFIDDDSSAVFFSSPSSVDGFLASLDYIDLTALKIRLATIGSTTSARVRELNGKIFYESPVTDINTAITGLANELVQA